MCALRLRLKTFDYLGQHRYSLTFCTAARRPPFTSAVVVQIVIAEILSTAIAERFTVLTYCFMPDHVHLLVEGTTSDADLLCFVRVAKQRSGYRAAGLTGTALWQPSFYDRVLRDADSTVAVVKYIIENPVRAGLAASVGDYEFIGSSVWSVEELIEAVSVPQS